MEILQKLVQAYLQSGEFNLLDTREGFCIADRPGFGGDHDTRLIWVTPSSADLKGDFSQLEQRLLKDFEVKIPAYPGAKRIIVAYSHEGFSDSFRMDAGPFGVEIKPALEFFDTPFLIEVNEKATSVLKSLREEPQRVPQPYSRLFGHEVIDKGEDLLDGIFDEFRATPQVGPCIRIIVGPAGVGKTILFQSLFSRLYNKFIEHKKSRVIRREDGGLRIFPRPIPLLPKYLLQAVGRSGKALLASFMRTEVAASVGLKTFEWMLINGFLTWMFDGLDELYNRDPDFFEDTILNILTSPNSKAQIILCARDSLLSSCEPFIAFLEEYGQEEVIRIYRLDDWEYHSKRAFAWLRLEGTDIRSKKDPPGVSQFLNPINQSESLRFLSRLPYYCNLLMGLFKDGVLTDLSDEFALIDYVIKQIIKREEDKGLLSPDQFQAGGVPEWLETLASIFYQDGFKGLNTSAVEEFAELFMHPNLPQDERKRLLTALVQFPLFAPGTEPNVITFKHELIPEYLTGKYLLELIVKTPSLVAESLGERMDFANTLIARYMAKSLPAKPNGMQAVINALISAPLPGRAFANLLQLLLSADPASDLILRHHIKLEARNLRGIQFIQRDLSGISFCNCDLSGTVFKACNLKNARFAGAYFQGTQFDHITKDNLIDAQFGNLEHFSLIYIGKQKVDDVQQVGDWIKKMTNRPEPIQHPCPSALQLRTLFLKFIYPDGKWRRDELNEFVLLRGKRYPKAPLLQDFVRACLRFGYLVPSTHVDRLKRAPGDRYDEMIQFVRNWRSSSHMTQLLNSVCPIADCIHVPQSFSN